MGFWKTFFGGADENPEEEKKQAEEKTFDLMKFDGVKAMRIGRHDYAVKCFREALKIHDDLEVRDYLSRVYIHLGDLESALAELKTIAAAAPDNQMVLLQAAHVAYMLEDYQDMKQLCEQALALDEANPAAHYYYAQSFIGQMDRVSGVAHLTKAIELKADYGDARLLRAQTLTKMGDLYGALDDTQWLLNNFGHNEDVLLLAARLMRATGNVEKALAIYGVVIEENPFQLDAYRERGKIKYDIGDKQGAEEDMQKLLELNPSELDGAGGEYKAESVEQMMQRAYSPINPFGL